VLEAARRRFLSDGYAATTLRAVAHDAGVSQETIYKRFGSKAGLVRALRDDALLGSRLEPAEARSDALRSERDPRVLVRGWAELAAEVAPIVAPILLLVRDAALLDPRMRDVQAELDEDRWRRMRENADHLATAGHLRNGVRASAAADVLFAVSSPEMFELLVVRQEWSLRRYSGFIEETIARALL
jgi:AcrR family transcriptional regulator